MRNHRLRPRHRRGTVLIIVVGAALIVALLAMAGMTSARIQRRRAQNRDHIHSARLYTQAGLDMALHRIGTDPNWRPHGAGGEWETDLDIGDGFYSLTMSDPEDDDVDGPQTSSDYLYDPVLIVATGKSGPAAQELRLRVDFGRIGVEALRSSMHAQGSIEFKGVAAHSDHLFTAGGNIVADDDGNIISEVFTDVAANGSVQPKGDSVFHGATNVAVNFPLTMPDPVAVYDYYLANGTVIDIHDIPLWDDQLLDNPSMEGPPPDPPTTGWEPYGNCTLEAYSSKKKDGNYSLQATGRLAATDGPSQDITNKLASDVTFYVLVNAGFVSGSKSKGRLVIEYESTGEGLQTWTSVWRDLEQGKFVTLESADQPLQPDSFTPVWTGQLIAARIRVETQDSLQDVMIDAAVLQEWHPYPSIIRAIHRTVLGPNHNPFGSGETNPEGIYVIDCEGDWVLSIQRARIMGTLVILNPKAGTFVWSVVNWSPAVSNFPALLSNGGVNFWLANHTEYQLDEAHDNVNYNPSGAPYQALSDADKLDVYPALMRGIVYSPIGIALKYRPTLEGVLITHGNIVSESTDLLGQTVFDVTYLSHYYREAPPGFRAPPVLRLAPGSFRPN
jgi:hypothetical protein